MDADPVGTLSAHFADVQSLISLKLATGFEYVGEPSRKIDQTKELNDFEAETANECLAEFEQECKRLGQYIAIPPEQKIVFLRALMACYWQGWNNAPTDDF